VIHDLIAFARDHKPLTAAYIAANLCSVAIIAGGMHPLLLATWILTVAVYLVLAATSLRASYLRLKR
jgi:hypothetical protein